MKKILLIISIISVLFLAGCNKNQDVNNDLLENNDKQNQDVENNLSENTNNKQEEQINNNVNSNFIEFNIGTIDDSYSSMRYLIGKNENGVWQEILHENINNIIGKYNDRLYFDNEDGIYYIDLTKKPYDKVLWIKYRVYGQETEDSEVLKESISNPYMIGDEIYFNFNLFAGGKESTDGIQKININSTSLEDAEQVLADADFGWSIDIKNKVIYYGKYESGPGNTLYKYDIESNEKEMMFEMVEDFNLKSDKILYYVYTFEDIPNDKENTNYLELWIKEGYTPHYDLFLYDLNTKQNQHISSSTINNVNSGCLSSYAEYQNGDVYYKSGNNIIKYNNGKNDVIYTYSSNDGGEYFYGFIFASDDVIEIILQLAKNKYLLDGKLYEEFPISALTDVIMLDGTINKLLIK